MDPKFADRMSDLSAITDDILEERWTTLTEIANAATQHNQARLVLIACGAGLSREGDSWFWQPFREHEKTLPVDDGAELFTRFAECATRDLISDGQHVLPAMLLRLACNAGLKPFSQDLVDTSVARLRESSVALPRFLAPARVLDHGDQEAPRRGCCGFRHRRDPSRNSRLGCSGSADRSGRTGRSTDRLGRGGRQTIQQ